MLKNDIRYIIKKILIGIGICVGLFYLKSCNVYAQNIEHIEYVEPFYNYTFDYDLDLDTYNHYFLKIKYSSTQVRYDLYYFNGTVDFECYWSTNCNVNGTIDTTKNRTIRAKRNESFSSKIYTKTYTISNGTYTTNTTNNTIFYETNFDSFNLATDTNNGVNIYIGNPILLLINYNLSVNNNAFTISKDYYNNNNLYDPTPPPPYIDSINSQPILSDNDSILLGYDFTYSIENFDSDNYKFFYKVGDSPRLQVFENDYNFSVRTNTTVYFIIEDLEGNLIDSQTFTIFDIGLSYNGQYDISFTYNNLTDSDSTNDSTNVSDLINRVDIDATFFPKSNILKYQYQFVNSGSSLTNNWLLLNNNNSNNVLSYTTHSNGTLYTRILDSNDTVLYSSTFQVDSIGKLKIYGSSNNRVNSFLSKLTGSINYGGPISSLIVMPINLLNTIIESSTQVCTPYSFGSLLGTEIIFPCVDLEDYVGVVLWRLIDLLMSFGVIMGISRFIKSKYNLLMSLNDDRDVM